MTGTGGDFGLESVDTYLEITWDDSLVGTAGFEPATPESRTQCSTRLSHVPTRSNIINEQKAVSSAPGTQARHDRKNSLLFDPLVVNLRNFSRF